MIDIVCDPNMTHHVSHAYALALGLEKHGFISRTIAPWEPVTADVCACWGWRLGAPLVAAGKRTLVMEHGFLGDRKTWTSFGWNGLNGRATFAPAKDSDRFDMYFGDLLKPWNPEGDYALLVGQVEGDASLHGMDFQAWATRIAARMQKHLQMPVKYRPHPVALEYGQKKTVPGAETVNGTLAEALAGAAVVVTFNSNSATESVLAGKPTITLDAGAIAYEVTAHDFTIQDEPDRLFWARELAWRQFNMKEIRDGTAWEHAGAVLRGG